ncbi:hypothetical protein HGRIS_006562 [Hohenbuehelia grisea]|uniref:P-loop containing nucleoside triphosphate hydrolase protein n=1 Tax=Hohenbuehelia grisea TaxID=104357 RepID=A0ABR3J9L9_9AGAR
MSTGKEEAEDLLAQIDNFRGENVRLGPLRAYLCKVNTLRKLTEWMPSLDEKLQLILVEFREMFSGLGYDLDEFGVVSKRDGLEERGSQPGDNAWDKGRDTPAAKVFQVGGPGITKFNLFWHQKAAVAALCRHSWKVTETAGVTGVLIADGVGLGKTATAMAYTAQTQRVWTSENKDGIRPAIVADRPFFVGKGKVPNAPHLYVVHPSLVHQWHSEIKRNFAPGSVDIFILPTAMTDVHKFFNDSQGAWAKSKIPLVFRIILCAHSTFVAMTQQKYETAAARHRRKPVDAPRRAKTGKKASRTTIFDFQWCTMVLDEAHYFRGNSSGAIGMFAFRNQVAFTILMTATPIMSNIRDILNLGRMIGIAQMKGEDGYEYEKALNRDLGKARREAKRANSKAAEEVIRTMAQGQEAHGPDPSDPLITVQYDYIKKIQAAFNGAIIRRSSKSKTAEGKGISESVKDYVEHFLLVKLTEREYKQLFRITAEMVKSGKFTNDGLLFENFWIHYQLGLIFLKDPEDLSDGYPELSDMEEYNPLRSTKLDVLCDLLQHLLSDDTRHFPSYSVEEKKIVFPALPPAPENGVRPQSRKVLVYHEFPTMLRPILSIMKLNGITPIPFNGTMKQAGRDAAVERFIQSDEPDSCVLLFSSVGATGLNLVRADVVILLDCIWSPLAKDQIIGRAHRFSENDI